MKLDDFETRLSRQPMKQIPGEWRAEILSAGFNAQANRRSSSVVRQSWLSTFNQQLSTLLWPHPKAWAGLAAAWVLILVLNFSVRDAAPVMAEKSAPPSPEVLVQLRQQQKMLAELIGSRETDDADRSKTLVPQPRSARAIEAV